MFQDSKGLKMKNSIKNLIAALIFFGLFLATVEYLSAGEREHVEDAILYTVSNHDNVLKYRYSEKVPAYTDKAYRQELAEAFIVASNAYKIDVYLLVSIGYFETIFRDLIGDHGRSLGIMQVGIMGRKRCVFDMSTPQGQILTGACWLNEGRKWCGTTKGALTAYASGKCTAPNANTKRAVSVRFKLAEILKGVSNDK
jgi:hypothetical protein